MTIATETIGYRIIESIHLTVPFEDWSRVRSRARAERRMKRGFRQNVRFVQKPDPAAYVIGGALHMHPETARALREEIKRRKGIEEALRPRPFDIWKKDSVMGGVTS